MRTQEVGNSARLRVDHQQSGEGNEIEQITTSPAQHERGNQQREQVAVGGEAEAEQPDREPERGDQPGRREQRRAAIQVLARWAPLLGGFAILCGTVALMSANGVPERSSVAEDKSEEQILSWKDQAQWLALSPPRISAPLY